MLQRAVLFPLGDIFMSNCSKLNTPVTLNDSNFPPITITVGEINTDVGGTSKKVAQRLILDPSPAEKKSILRLVITVSVCPREVPLLYRHLKLSAALRWCLACDCCTTHDHNPRRASHQPARHSFQMWIKLA